MSAEGGKYYILLRCKSLDMGAVNAYKSLVESSPLSAPKISSESKIETLPASYSQVLVFEKDIDGTKIKLPITFYVSLVDKSGNEGKEEYIKGQVKISFVDENLIINHNDAHYSFHLDPLTLVLGKGKTDEKAMIRFNNDVIDSFEISEKPFDISISNGHSVILITVSGELQEIADFKKFKVESKKEDKAVPLLLPCKPFQFSDFEINDPVKKKLVGVTLKGLICINGFKTIDVSSNFAPIQKSDYDYTPGANFKFKVANQITGSEGTSVDFGIFFENKRFVVKKGTDNASQQRFFPQNKTSELSTSPSLIFTNLTTSHDQKYINSKELSLKYAMELTSSLDFTTTKENAMMKPYVITAWFEFEKSKLEDLEGTVILGLEKIEEDKKREEKLKKDAIIAQMKSKIDAIKEKLELKEQKNHVSVADLSFALSETTGRIITLVSKNFLVKEITAPIDPDDIVSFYEYSFQSSRENEKDLKVSLKFKKMLRSFELNGKSIAFHDAAISNKMKLPLFITDEKGSTEYKSSCELISFSQGEKATLLLAGNISVEAAKKVASASWKNPSEDQFNSVPDHSILLIIENTHKKST